MIAVASFCVGMAGNLGGYQNRPLANAFLGVAGLCVLYLLGAGPYRFVQARRSARRGGEGGPPTRSGAVGPRGDLSVRPIRRDQSVPQEEINAQWDATCEFVPASLNQAFGRGVRLSLQAKEGQSARDLRCVVTDPGGARHENVQRHPGLQGARTHDSYHFPGEFRSAPEAPWPVGYYRYVWTGDHADLGEDSRTEVLARRFFHVDVDGKVTCHLEVGGQEGAGALRAPPAMRPQRTWRLRPGGRTLMSISENTPFRIEWEKAEDGIRLHL